MNSSFIIRILLLCVLLAPIISSAQEKDTKSSPDRILLLDGTEIRTHGEVTIIAGTIHYQLANGKKETVRYNKVKAMKVGKAYFARVPVNQSGTNFDLLELRLQNSQYRVFEDDNSRFYTLYILDVNNQPIKGIESMRIVRLGDMVYKKSVPKAIEKLAGYFPDCPEIKKRMEDCFNKNEDITVNIGYETCDGGPDPELLFTK